MKTITIPKRFGYPTMDVVINGKVYTVESGNEIEVEDSVAEAIENAIALEPVTIFPKSKLAQHADGSLTEITADDLAGITKLHPYCLYQANYLKVVTIPDSVTEIGDYALAGCWRLNNIYLPETPPLVGKGVFDAILATATFHCKTEESLKAYRSAEGWKTLASTYTFAVG